jgi:putative endopeptidase
MTIFRNKSALFPVLLAAVVFSAYKVIGPVDPANDPVFKNLDQSVRPNDDFFKYANGGWLKRNPIPAAYSSWGIGNVVQEDVLTRLKKISEDAVKTNAALGTATQKIGDFYYTGLDTATLEKQGLAPIQPQLDLIDKMQNTADLLHVAALLNTYQVRSLFSIGIEQDAKNSSKMILSLGQGGISLPNRDYYFKTDARTTGIRNDYRTKHVPAMLQLSGWSTAQSAQAAERIYKIEEFLAGKNRSLQDLRDPYKNYNKLSIAGLNKLTPQIDWNTMATDLELKAVDSVVVGQPEYYTALNTALKTFSLDDWKAYMRWKVLSANANYLNKALNSESFRFYGTVMSGRKEQLPRTKQVLNTENRLLGELLGQLFVKEYFPAAAKKRYTDMVEAIRVSYKEHIEKLDWMSPQTKQKALAKLRAIHPKVGYPDKWKDFSKLNIGRKSYAENVAAAMHWDYLQDADKLGKPVDYTEWGMTPQTYNAYYNPSKNEIVLPAAQFLIPGVQDAQVDDAVAYGYAAASTIGHEITHGFDDEGRQFDANGNLKVWWTVQDSLAFAKRTKMLADQFSGYVVLDSLHINGQATLGENIADLGGIAIGITAFKKTEQYKENKAINGLSPMQRFFLGYALGWLGQTRNEALANQILTDVHSPGFLRVNGPFSDVPEFYEAFHIKKGDKMWLDPEKRVKIW